MTPAPTAVPNDQQPGGGQRGVQGAAAPPPPPPVKPAPIVVQPGDDDPTATVTADSATAWDGTDVARMRLLAWLEQDAAEQAPEYHPATEVAGFVTFTLPEDPRLVAFRTQWGPAAQRLLDALARGLGTDGGLALRFPAPRS